MSAGVKAAIEGSPAVDFCQLVDFSGAVVLSDLLRVLLSFLNSYHTSHSPITETISYEVGRKKLQYLLAEPAPRMVNLVRRF